MSNDDLAQMFRAIVDTNSIGGSIYDDSITSAGLWDRLRAGSASRSRPVLLLRPQPTFCSAKRRLTEHLSQNERKPEVGRGNAPGARSAGDEVLGAGMVADDRRGGLFRLVLETGLLGAPRRRCGPPRAVLPTFSLSSRSGHAG